MNKVTGLLAVALVGALTLSTQSLNAASFTLGSTVTVTENSVSPTETINLYNDLIGGTYTVYAGINNLTVGGVSVQGFCIDPFHFSASGPLSGYTVADLATAPKPPGGGTSGMGAIKANAISELWAMNFHGGNLTPAQAAALLIAIWEIVGTDGGTGGNQIVGNAIQNFRLSGNATALADATALLNGLTTSGPGADLVALTHSDNGQDYVIANVPDGATTLGLVGMGLLAITAFGRKLRVV